MLYLRICVVEIVIKTEKLTLTHTESQRELSDEFLQQSGEYRIRVTGQPTSTRIHYIIKSDKIIFLEYCGEGKHDERL